MLLTERGLELLAVASEQTNRNQEELRDMIEGSSRELGEMKSDLKAQALAVRGNWSMIRKLLCMFSGEIEAPLKSLSQTVTKIWWVAWQKINNWLEVLQKPSLRSGTLTCNLGYWYRTYLRSCLK